MDEGNCGGGLQLEKQRAALWKSQADEALQEVTSFVPPHHVTTLMVFQD